MTEDDLQHLMHEATRDISASDSLRVRLTNRRPARTGARRWWVAGLAAAAAAATLIAVPLLRPATTASAPATPPAMSTQPTSPMSAAVDPSGTSPVASGVDENAPTPADITACRTDAANSPPRTHPWLLCFFVPNTASTSAGALVIGVVDPVAVSALREGLSVRSAKLCLQTYPLWVVAGDLGRRGTTGCGDGDNWQNDIDDQAGHIRWTVVDSGALCGASVRTSALKVAGPVRMALLCRPGAPASVVTGATATAWDAVTRLPSVGAPCTPTGWSLTTVAGLEFHRATLPTVNSGSDCQLAPQAEALIEEKAGPVAVIQGRLQMAGGPAPGTPRPITGDITVHRGTTTDGQIVATGKADSNGRFVIDVATGSYTLTGTSPMIQDGQALCRAETPVTVASGQTITDANVTCSIS